jgi:dynein heavy chain
VNCCTLDWFSNWPKEALFEVANRFLDKMPGIESAAVKDSIA